MKDEMLEDLEKELSDSLEMLEDSNLEELTPEMVEPLANITITLLEKTPGLLRNVLNKYRSEMFDDWLGDIYPTVAIPTALIGSEYVLDRGLTVNEIKDVTLLPSSERTIRRKVNESFAIFTYPDPSPPHLMPHEFNGRPRRVDKRHVFYKFGLDPSMNPRFSPEVRNFLSLYMERIKTSAMQYFKSKRKIAQKEWLSLVLDLTDNPTFLNKSLNLMVGALKIPTRLEKYCYNNSQIERIRTFAKAHHDLKKSLEAENIANLRESIREVLDN